MGVLDVVLHSCPQGFLVGTLVALLLGWFIFSFRRHHQGPPGPRPLPLIGNLLQLDIRRLNHSLMELSKKYGSVFTIYLGPKKVVVLAGFKTVKEALVTYDEEFGDRNPLVFATNFSQRYGVTWSNGDSWREMRRFAIKNLRDFGMGKKTSEEKILEECERLIDVWRLFKGEAFSLKDSLSYAISNIICSIVYGSRFEYDDPEFTSLVDQTNRRFRLSNSLSMQMYNLFPWFFGWTKEKKESHNLVVANMKQNLSFITRLKVTLDPQMCRGFVDAFLTREQSLKDSGITNSHFSDENLLMTVINLFGGGTDTVSLTMQWGLLYMAKYPRIQDQVQEELRSVLGSRQVQAADRKELHFTNAVIHETQRLASIAPLGVPHKTTRDVTLNGHFIKKDTTVYTFLKSVLYDEVQWERPHSFHPAHFLDKDGKFVKRDAFLPFSAGRRVCLGESLARMELFIFFAGLLQRFRFTPPPGVSEDDLDLTQHGGFTLNPSPHKLCAVPRED